MNDLYITRSDYAKYWELEDIPEDFKNNYVLAKEKINSVTHNRIVALGFDKLTDFQKEKIKLAMFHQIKFIEENGTEENDVSSYSVLDISISVDKNSQSKAQKLHMSDFALDQLQKTGLCTNNFRWR
ncbi:MAG: hypothetical protein HFI08_02160 [Bacilli bacterium]|jgi:hypothetical protein|nr:hypothetical protein [Bacilli bacterium]